MISTLGCRTGPAALAAAVLLAGCSTHITLRAFKMDDRNAMPAADKIAVITRPQNIRGDLEVKAREMRELGVLFEADKEKDLEIYGDLDQPFTLNLLAESLNVPGDTFPTPTEITIQTASAHSVGEVTQDGVMEVRFGQDGPVFSTDAPGDNFFEMSIADITDKNGDKVASGWFHGLVTNKNDSSDLRTVFILNGTILTRVKNH